MDGSAAATGGDGTKDAGPMDMEAFRKMAKYTLVKMSDMLADCREDAVDIVTTAVDKHGPELEKCTQMIKENMDKKFRGPFHCVCGQSFAFEVTHEVNSMLYVFVGPSTGVLLWKQ